MDFKFGKGINKRVIFFVAAAVVIVAVIAAIIICFTVFSGNAPSKNGILVYKNDTGYVIRIGKLECDISDKSANDFKCDSENNRVFYTVPSSFSDGLYDLYYVEKSRSELKKPKIIDYGIEKNYILNSGKIYYLKNNSDFNADDAFCCDFKSSTVESFASNVETIYPLSNSNTVFFIKLHGSERVLYKYSGESNIEVSRNISTIHLYNDCEIPHILYEVNSKIYSGMTELYRSEAEGAPELICDNTFKILYDEYTADGNLYYFTSSTENISWSYVIADAYSESDKTITKPKRDSFLSILGISLEYNQKLREYQDKLVRDEIRKALNESVDNGEFTAPVYNAFAYNSSGSHKVAENINPQNVLAVSSDGFPKIIFENMEIVQSSTDMSTLVEIAQRSSMAEVKEYARSIISDSIKSTGIKIAGCDDLNRFSHDLTGFEKNNTLFTISNDGNRIFALTSDSAGGRLKLYSCVLGSDLTPSAVSNINNGISDYYFIDNSIIYLKSDVGKNTGDIYSYFGEDNIKISNAANALKVENEKDIVILKNYTDSSFASTADYYIIKESNEELLAEKIYTNSFVVNNLGEIAYISDTESGKKLFVYSDGKSAEISDDVSELFLFS